MAFAEINADTKIYYELEGHGQPVVLISGYRGDHSVWDLIKPKLTSQSQILTFDNLCIGQTVSKTDPLTIEKMADLTVQLSEKLGLVNPHIVGQSMGGAIAQIIARKYGNKIGKVILLNTVSKYNRTTIQILEGILQLRQEGISPEILFKLGLPLSFSNQFLEIPSNIAAYKAKMLSNPYLQSIECQKQQLEAVKIFDSRAWLNEIKNSVLVMGSEEDIIVRPSESVQLAQTLNTKLLMIPGGHASLFECPDAVTEALIKFLF